MFNTSWASIIDSRLGWYIVAAVFAIQAALCFISLTTAKLKGIKFIPVTLALFGLSLVMIVVIGVGFGGNAFLDFVPRFIVLFAIYFARFIAHIALADVAAWFVFFIYWRIKNKRERKKTEEARKVGKKPNGRYDRY